MFWGGRGGRGRCWGFFNFFCGEVLSLFIVMVPLFALFYKNLTTFQRTCNKHLLFFFTNHLGSSL